MLVIWAIIGVLATMHPPLDWALSAWHWFGDHVFLTILMILFLA